MANPSEQVEELMFFALEHAVKSVVGSNGPLIPFALVISANGERSLERFTTGQNPEEARQHARAHVSKAKDCIGYAVAGDGHFREGDTRFPVVIVEAGHLGDRHGFVIIQRFASSPELRFAAPIRNPSIIDRPELLLHAQT